MRRRLPTIARILTLCGTISACAQSPPVDPAGLCAIEGQVVDAVTNAPVHKAMLTLSGNGGGPWPSPAAPDPGGRFSFQNLAPGKYSLSATATGYLRLSPFETPQPRRSGTAFSLAPGQKLSGIVLRLTPSSAISGRIVDQDGDPLAGVEMQLWTTSYFYNRKELTAATSQAVRTDDRGIYRIPLISPGKYYLSATLPAEAQLRSDSARFLRTDSARYLHTYYPGTLDPSAAAPIQLIPGTEMENLNFKLSKVQTVHVGGRVLGTSIADIVLSPDTVVGNAVRYSTRTALPDGRFDFDGLPPGTHNLQARIRGDRPMWATRSITVGSAGVGDLAIAPAPGASLTTRITIEGRDASDRSIDYSGIGIQFWPDYAGPGVMYAEAPRKDGTFDIDDIVPGRYRVHSRLTPPGFYLKSVRSESSDLSGRILTLTAGAHARIEAVLSANAASVTGTVSLSDSDVPAAEVTVILIPQETDRRQDKFAYPKTITDDSGKFSIRDIPPGQYKALVWEFGESNATLYLDPDFIRPLEVSAVSVALAESEHADIKLTVTSRR